MNISNDDFRRHFEVLSDETLLATKPEDLVDAARSCFEEELAARGLKPGTPAPVAEAETTETDTAASHELAAGDELVLIGTYTVADDASLARGLLESASIPARLENQSLGLGAFQLRLMVPASFEEQALEVLEYEISDEDLAAQAEAAGEFGFEEEEEEEEAEEETPED